ncbi:hypothetical protein DACRYDRAFT_107526 [Dacryopinax primogenitus]|uniref:non-specific serine/threonine protein kinase n=1 Tax=Dacryopinax primogenitus (strain DJM 731) TaxID=1858805 RepID=M5G0X2_DACPD|nr:uncharacterized protein DACRYDRAFT_107526 [Dacryopinax primogenitus]EJU01790.1 hypothetical protein DACRYDRAFT_107526 [Dacryopinax primogenitus]
MFPASEERIDRKYGKWGRVLGKGTGGTVRLIQGPPRSGGKVFAVKEFRKKKGKETEFEYRRMIATECCFANGLKHVNVIETVDIVRNKSRYFQVMEYAPYDLFSVVMSGKMVQPEVYCVFRQICDGVCYLHSTGLAHRDLKLENCVMTNSNVVKLIDFGTATPSFHPDKGLILSSGLVGSDPYVAPEVIRGEMYDARKADVWSLGIIFLAMMLRRFPWALADPRKDLNYRKFASTLHELPARPRTPPSPRRRVSTGIKSSANGTNGKGPANGTAANGTANGTIKLPVPKPRQRSAEEGFDSSASSGYDVPAPSLWGAGEGSITTFTSVESSLVLTPSDTGGSRASGPSAPDGEGNRDGEREGEEGDADADSLDGVEDDNDNWVEPRLESYENWEEVIERLCAERESSSSSEASSRSSLRSSLSPREVTRNGTGYVQPPSTGNGFLRPPEPHVRRETSEPALNVNGNSNGLRPPSGLQPNRLPRPAISTNFNFAPASGTLSAHPVLGEGLSASPLSAFPPKSAPPEQHPFAASSPTLPSQLRTLPALVFPHSQGQSQKGDEREQEPIIVSPDNTLSYLPAETRWSILCMLQIEPNSRCGIADLLYPTPAQAQREEKVPSGLQMTPARRATTPLTPTPTPAPAPAPTSAAGRRREKGIQEMGREWLKSVVPCSGHDQIPGTPGTARTPQAPTTARGNGIGIGIGEGAWGAGTGSGVGVGHVHVRLKTSQKEGKWWKRG